MRDHVIAFEIGGYTCCQPHSPSRSEKVLHLCRHTITLFVSYDLAMVVTRAQVSVAVEGTVATTSPEARPAVEVASGPWGAYAPTMWEPPASSRKVSPWKYDLYVLLGRFVYGAAGFASGIERSGATKSRLALQVLGTLLRIRKHSREIGYVGILINYHNHS